MRSRVYEEEYDGDSADYAEEYEEEYAEEYAEEFVCCLYA